MQALGLSQYGLFYRHVKEGDNFWWVAPIFAQSKIAFNRLRRRLVNIPGYHFNKSNLIITTPLGTEIHFKSADNPDSLYGENVYAVVCDEATRMKKEAWEAVYSTTTVTHAIIKLIGNVVPGCFWFAAIKEQAINGSEDWEYFNIDCYAALDAGHPLFTLEAIEKAKRIYDEKTFSELYLAKETEATGQLPLNNKIDELFTNERKGYRKYMTADIAFLGADLFVIGIWEGWCLTHIYSIPKSDPEEVVKLIVDYSTIHNISPSDVAYDGDGVGMYLSGWLRTAFSFKAGAAVMKEKDQLRERDKMMFADLDSQVLYNTALRINDNTISIHADIEGDVKARIKKEMKFIRRKSVSNDKKIKCESSTDIKKEARYSPDYLAMIKIRQVFELGENAAMAQTFE